MNEMLDLKTIVDIGFVIFVMAICFRSVGDKKKESEDLATAWKGELEQLANSLRELVEEAGASSRNLDRRLAQRQKDLEKLLKEIDAKSANLEVNQDDDLPNDSWRVEPRKPQKTAQSNNQNITAAQKVERALQQKKERELAQSRIVKQQPVTQPSLVSQIEVSSEVSDSELLKNNPTSITDPVALSIAKRLLLAGKELHVVARKLEVPIAEVRELEIYLRGAKESKEIIKQDQNRRVTSSVVELREDMDQSTSLDSLIDQIEDRSFV